MAHITVDLLFASWSGELSKKDLHWLTYSHLVQICPVCAKEYAKFAQVQKHLTHCLAHPQLDTSERAEELIRLLDGPPPLAEKERRRAQRWLKSLDELPYERWEAKIDRARTRLRGPAFAFELLESARAATPDDPQRIYACAAAAQQVAGIFHPQRSELYALAIAHQVNALRLQSDYRAAGARASVLSLVLQEVDAPLALAEVGSLLGSFYMDMRRFGHARTHLRRALALYNSLDREVLAARIRLQLSGVEHYAGNSAEAVAILESVEELDLAAHPDLRLVVQLNLAMMRCALGDAERAHDILQALSPWESHLSGRHRLNYRWIAARVAAGLGRWQEALDGLEALKSTYDRMGLDYCCALIALDIAAVHLDRGDIESAVFTVEQVVDDLQRFHLEPDAEAWAQELQMALGRRMLTASFLRSRLRHLEHASHRMRNKS
ncbi:MAG: hypothetical protein AAGD01_20180 [Acidobacteriota bacterium]